MDNTAFNGQVFIKVGQPPSMLQYGHFGIETKPEDNQPIEGMCILEDETGNWHLWPAITTQLEIENIVTENAMYFRNITTIWMNQKDYDYYTKSVTMLNNL